MKTLKTQRKNSKPKHNTQVSAIYLLKLSKEKSTPSVSQELLHYLAFLRLLMKPARQVAYIFISSKVIFRKNALHARQGSEMPATTLEEPRK